MAVQDEKKAYEFCMGFVANSDAYRRQYLETWREVLANFTVSPTWDTGTTTPYRDGKVYGNGARNMRDAILLKDPETHKAIMMYASKLVRVLFSERDRGYIKSRPRGYEDADLESPTVNRLLRYVFGLPGHFRTMVEGIVDMLLFGTSIIEVGWKYEEREMPVRAVSSELGMETESFSRMRIPVYDDVKMTVVDVFDFYPDPSRYRLQDMSGAAKRFRMNGLEARAKAKGGTYDQEAVNRALANIGKSDPQPSRWDNPREGLDQPRDRVAHADFKDMMGYEYWGDVPWEDDLGSSRRVITVLNNVVVQNRPWPLSDPELPFHSLIINPIQGRFYGISPGETIRFNQDFIDALLVLLAEAVIRQVHPPIAVDSDGDVDLAKIKAWKADAIITARGGPNAVGTLRYDANVPNAFALMAGLKDSAQQAMGSLGGIQGEPGPDREAATVGAQRLQFALDRPELAAMVIEQECLPPIGRAILHRCQQFLDTEGLKQRIGELPESAWIGDIMGDFDVEFVGSRVAMSRQEKLQALDRLSAMAQAIPPLQMQIPWADMGQDLIGNLLELPEIAAKMADPQTTLMNMLMMQAGQGGGAGQNGVPTSSEPAGMMPAQTAGAIGEVG